MRTRQILMLSGLVAGAFGTLSACGNGGTGGGITNISGSGGTVSGGSAGATGGGSAGTTGSGSAGTTGSGAAGTTSSGAAGTTSGGAAGTTSSGAAGSGEAGTTSGGSAGTTSGGSAGTTGSGSAGTTGAAGTGASAMTMGCGKTIPSLVTLGKWSIMASTVDPKGKVEPAGGPPAVTIVGPDGKSWPRGFWMLVPTNYDKNKPSRVVFEGAGCDDFGSDAGGMSVYDYHTVAAIKNNAEQTIQVGLDYDPVRTDYCYDDHNPQSNDFAFFPYLHKFVEDNFCVDTKHEFFSGYSSGSWLANQLTCAFPDVLRGVVLATGEEPTTLPTCVQGHPVAGLFLHEIDDPYNAYTAVLPACARLLTQNGCATTTCAPSNLALSTPYTKPTFTAGANPPPKMDCVSFNGCPATAPVVFCTTNGLVQGTNKDPGHYIGAGTWIPELFADFITKF
jgi:poly(3-hydroxybutyrate) depolymerase